MQALPHGILLNDYINMCMFKIKIMCFHFFMLYKWTLFIKKFFTTHDCFGFYIIEFRKRKSIFCTSEVSLCFTQKSNLYIMNKSNWLECIQVYWVYIYIYIYIYFYIFDLLNIFDHVALENIFRILNNSLQFQNIIVCNKPLSEEVLA